MKIQEIESGSSHIDEKVDDEGRENISEVSSIIPPTGGAGPAPATLSELSEPRWSVVSFDKREAGGLTYGEAVELTSELDSKSVTGLCIVTDDAASRVGS